MTLSDARDTEDENLKLIIETQGSLVSFFRYFKTARLNAGVSKVLQDWAFAAPIPIRLDGRKLNTLHACPTHSEGVKQQTLVAVFLQSAQPGLHLPWQHDGWSPISRQIGADNVQNIGCCALLTVGTKFSRSTGEVLDWRRSPPGSLFYWIQSGVVIRSERLPSRGVGLSWAVLLSADGLETDLTSFSLLEVPELLARKKTVMLSLLDNLKSYRLRHEDFFQLTEDFGRRVESQVSREVKEQAEQWKSEFRM